MLVCEGPANREVREAFLSNILKLIGDFQINQINDYTDYTRVPRAG